LPIVNPLTGRRERVLRDDRKEETPIRDTYSLSEKFKQIFEVINLPAGIDREELTNLYVTGSSGNLENEGGRLRRKITNDRLKNYLAINKRELLNYLENSYSDDGLIVLDGIYNSLENDEAIKRIVGNWSETPIIDEAGARRENQQKVIESINDNFSLTIDLSIFIC
jgi:hypothetical protein